MSMAASQSSVIGKEALVDFFCAPLNLLMNLGTRGSSYHHICMVADISTTLAR